MTESVKPRGSIEPDPVPFVLPRDTRAWATDVVVSHPEPPLKEQPVLVSFGGFGFTTGGVTHAITEALLEEMLTPMYAPEGFRRGG